MMNEFNRNDNEMNENLPDPTEKNKADETTEPKPETNETADNLNTNDRYSESSSSEPAAQETPAPEAAPADGAYSFTRDNIPNNTYNANANGGYADHMNRPQPQPQQNPYGAFGYGQQNPQNPQGNPNNGYASGGYRYNPAQGQPQQNPNGYGYGNSGSGYNNGQFTNSYAPQNRSYYGGMAQGDGSISYAPADTKKKKKEKKSSGSVSRGALALVCCLTVAFSGVFGFAGTYLANSMNKTVDANGNTVLNSGNTAVVYRTVEDIVTSTGAAKGEPLTYSQVADVVKDSVVEIMTEYTVQSMWYQYVTGGAGSGVIISDDGYIITNNHVICDDTGTTVADNITVRLTNGEEYKATAIGADADSDIAILKIEAQGLTFAVAGNSDNLAVGEEVVVVGNPLGELGGTVTNGIVSATEREMEVNGVTMSLIQSNAAVNPGNSGGGMFNMKGELIGVVNAKSSGTGIEGLGFAIPINEALRINEQLLQYGYVRGKTMIGVQFQDISNNMFMNYYNLKPGVYVYALSEGYNDTVLEEGDRVIAVNGSEISSSSDIKAIVTESSVGDKLKFQLYREGKLIEVEVTCYEKVPDGMEGADIQFEEEPQP
ncbi:MAG: trypsin-like peptidase domain-containing protein [Clostridia bacterium]|nr:trypsin-like peptidase domain-containing protein [Clostridia bacterium]